MKHRDLVRTLALRLRSLLRRSETERELADELDFHVEMQTEANLRAGMAPEEARRQALIAFGGVERHAEACRDERSWRPLEELVRDALYALRGLRRSPGFAVAAVLTLALGVVLAWWGTRGILALAPAELPRLEGVGMDARVLGFATLVSLVSAVVFGLFPALRLTRSDLHSALRSGTRSTGTGLGRRGREALVVGQVALTLVVLAGAGLLVRSLARLQSLDPGFRPERLVLADVAQPWSEYATSEQNLALFDAILERVRALPGVTGATAVLSRPFSGNGGYDMSVTAEGQDAEAARANPMLNYEGVEPGYFETLGLSVLRGRAITAEDREDSPPVVVVNEATARLLWPGEDAVGKRLKWGLPETPGPWRTVAGATVVVVVAVVLASWLPARQATRVDPAVVLRAE